MADDHPHAQQRTVLVVDDSDRSRRALVDRATEFDGDELVVLYVLEPFVVRSVTESVVWDDEHTNRRERAARRLLAEYRELATAYGANVRTELAHGPSENAIANASGRFDADDVIVGYAERTGSSRLVPERIAETVLGRVFLRQ